MPALSGSKYEEQRIDRAGRFYERAIEVRVIPELRPAPALRDISVRPGKPT